MEQTEINGMLQRAKKYDAEKYLAMAVRSLRRNNKIDIEKVDYEWFVVANKLMLKIIYSVDGRTITLRVIESVFKDYQRKIDAKIGIKLAMTLESKIILRLAYLLFTHRNDF